MLSASLPNLTNLLETPGPVTIVLDLGDEKMLSCLASVNKPTHQVIKKYLTELIRVEDPRGLLMRDALSISDAEYISFQTEKNKLGQLRGRLVKGLACNLIPPSVTTTIAYAVGEQTGSASLALAVGSTLGGFYALVACYKVYAYKDAVRQTVNVDLIRNYAEKEKKIAKFKKPLNEMYKKYPQLGLFNPHAEAKPVLNLPDVQIDVREGEGIFEEKITNRTPLLSRTV